MEKIIDSISKENLIRELTPEKFLKHTSKGNNDVYSFTFREAPSVMYEVGRLREKSFRKIGCGTGQALDLDEHDVEPNSYQQLIVWNPRENEIVGGYRFALCQNHLSNLHSLSMTHYFDFSKRFVSDYLPYCVELGRAWVNPDYQPSSGERKSIFALDNLWDGLGAVIIKYPQIKYMYGKITFSASYNPIARVLLQWLLDHYLRDKNNMVKPTSPVKVPNVLQVSGICPSGNNFEQDYNSINRYIRSIGLSIPPLVNAYLGLTRKLTTFGTANNPELNNSFETGIMINIKDIYPEKYQRYVGSIKSEEYTLV